MTIRTPDDDAEAPGRFWPPFRPDWWYQGQTYAGHSDFAVDFNRRTQNGGWLDDRGDPVLAAASGTVKETTPADGYVLITHPGGYATEYRHMEPVRVKPGDKVKRGDLIGNIGEAGNAPSGTHLHHKHLRNGRAIKMAFLGKPVSVSVGNSDTRPATWDPPPPVMVQGPPPPVTWEQSYRQAIKALERAEDRAAACVVQVGALTEERDQARRDLALAVAKIKELEALPACDDVRDEAIRLRDLLGKVRALVTL